MVTSKRRPADVRTARLARTTTIELDALFAAMSDVVIVFDREGRCLQIAPTNPDLLYSQPEDTVGRRLHDIMPAEQADMFVAHIQTALAKWQPQTIEYPLEIQGKTLWFSAVISPMSADAVVYVARDITQRVTENQRLEQAVEERTRELAALVQTANAITSTLDLGRLMESLLDNLHSVIDYHGAGISLREGDRIRQLAVRRPPGFPTEPDVSEEDDTIGSMGEAWDRLVRGESIVVDDVLGPSPIAVAYRKSWGGDLKGTAAEYVRSLVSVPLSQRGEVTGLLSVAHSQPGYFNARHLDLLRAIADQASAAIDNVRLFAEAQSRSRELAALLEVSRAVASTLDTRTLMGVILDQLKTIIDHTGSAILTLVDGDLRIVDARARGGQEGEIGVRIPLDQPTALWRALQRGEAVIINDVRSNETMAIDYRSIMIAAGLWELPPFRAMRSWMAVPLRSKDQVSGVLTLSQVLTGYFTPEHARLARAFADQAALAIDNARLFEKAQHGAALEERQRLARELHDSVSQALYGIALGARTTRALLDRDPAEAVEPVDYISSLAKAGLAEMRALIFELRPESLENEGLVAAISKQAAAVEARHGLTVECKLGYEPQLPFPVKETLYRITQEALHNTVKHAGATTAAVALDTVDGRTIVTVEDNGAGFDPGGHFPGHLGLRSMKERVEKQGGSLVINSTPGKGTRVVAALPSGEARVG
jgi:PAS domain S-box-containing protein